MAKTQVCVYVDEDFALALKVACLKRRTTMTKEFQTFMATLLDRWGEPTSVLPQEVVAHG
jgi:hypothetical protein